MKVSKKLKDKIDWKKLRNLPKEKIDFYHKILIKNDKPEESELKEEREIQESYMFIAGIGMTLLAGMMINSLYRLFGFNNLDYLFLLHILIINVCFGFFVFIIYKIKLKIKKRREKLNLYNHLRNYLIYLFVKSDGLIKNPKFAQIE